MYDAMVRKIISYYGDFAKSSSSRTADGLAAASEEDHRAFLTKMAPVLAEFNATRENTHREIIAATKVWLPAGIAAAAAIIYFFVNSKTNSDADVGIVLMSVVGALYMATAGPSARYRQAFKANVMPHLFERFGFGGFSTSSRINAEPLRRLNLFNGIDEIELEDEFHGSYRSHDVSFAEIKIKGTNQEETTVYLDGLVMEFELPREIAGRTVIFPAKWKNEKKTSTDLEPVVLESPDFAQRYVVLSNDQVGARVLLSPAFMERLMKLRVVASEREAMANTSSLSFVEKHMLRTMMVLDERKKNPNAPIDKDFIAQSKEAVSNPLTAKTVLRDLLQRNDRGADVVAVAENGRLLIAMPKSEDINYFEPPPYYTSFDPEAVLMHITADIQQALNIADAVFDLDYRTRNGPQGVRLVHDA